MEPEINKVSEPNVTVSNSNNLNKSETLVPIEKKRSKKMITSIIVVVLIIIGLCFLYLKTSRFFFISEVYRTYENNEQKEAPAKESGVTGLNNLPFITMEQIGDLSEISSQCTSKSISKLTDEEKADFYGRLKIEPFTFDFLTICKMKDWNIGFTMNKNSNVMGEGMYDVWLYNQTVSKLLATTPTTRYEIVQKDGSIFLLMEDGVQHDFPGFSYPLTGSKIFIIDNNTLELKDIKTSQTFVNICPDPKEGYHYSCDKKPLIDKLEINKQH